MKRALRATEVTLWLAGAILLSGFVAATVHAEWLARADTQRFRQAQALQPKPGADVDQSVWSEGRRDAFAASLEVNLGVPEAILEIPDIDLEVPVWRGVDDVILNRAVGRVPGTAPVNASGNTAIAGHRDGWFRRLGKLAHGDIVRLQTLDETLKYRVVETMIVAPSAIEILEQGDDDILTLITFYPFYFVGPAPQRYIVVAERVEPDVITPEEKLK